MAALAPVVLLVVDYSVDYYKVFRNVLTASGRPIQVEQVEWKDLHAEGFYDPTSNEPRARVRCHLRASENPWPFSSQKSDRVVEPDFVLVRNFPSDVHDGTTDVRTQLLALMFGDLPGVNSLRSFLLCGERPLVHTELHAAAARVRSRLGADRVTIQPVPIHLKSNQRIGTQVAPLFGAADAPHAENSSATMGPVALPAVVKVASTHAGYGKIRITSNEDGDDLKSILALHKDYYTVEPLVPEIAFEYRIQRIGEHVRAFRRNSDTTWKNNWGNLQFEDHEVTEEHRLWAEECAKIFGGLDILAIDVLHKKDGCGVILEVNDTACGLMFEHEAEDVGHIRDVVVRHLNDLF